MSERLVRVRSTPATAEVVVLVVVLTAATLSPQFNSVLAAVDIVMTHVPMVRVLLAPVGIAVKVIVLVAFTSVTALTVVAAVKVLSAEAMFGLRNKNGEATTEIAKEASKCRDMFIL